jgi:hypothetical protein
VDDLTLHLLAFSAAGALAGLLLGLIGNRILFRAALVFGGLAAVFFCVSAALDHGWGQIGNAVYAALIVWAVMAGAGIYAAISALRHTRKNRDQTRSD